MSAGVPAVRHELQPQWKFGLPSKLNVLFFNVRQGKVTSRSVKSKT